MTRFPHQGKTLRRKPSQIVANGFISTRARLSSSVDIIDDGRGIDHIGLDEAMFRARSAALPLNVEIIGLEAATGRVLGARSWKPSLPSGKMLTRNTPTNWSYYASGRHVVTRSDTVERSSGYTSVLAYASGCDNAMPQAGVRIDALACEWMRDLGFSEVGVYRRPRIALLWVRSHASPEDRRAPPFPVSGCIDATSAQISHTETVANHSAHFLAAVRRALDYHADLVIALPAAPECYSTPLRALNLLGAEVLFNGVRIAGGKGILVARLPSSSLLVQMPTSRPARLVAERFIVTTILRAMAGLPPELPSSASLQYTVRKKADTEQVRRGTLISNDRGGARVQLCTNCSENRHANVWVRTPAFASTLAAGTVVDTFPVCALE